VIRPETDVVASISENIAKASALMLQIAADVYEDYAWLPSLDVRVVLRNLQHMQDGVYDYDLSNARLLPHKTAPMPASLQSIYFLRNLPLGSGAGSADCKRTVRSRLRRFWGPCCAL
jgi:hypothetical protein